MARPACTVLSVTADDVLVSSSERLRVIVPLLDSAFPVLLTVTKTEPNLPGAMTAGVTAVTVTDGCTVLV